MIELTFYGGVGGEVGGNMILLGDPKFDASILLDFGINYQRWSRYFNFPFSRPANHRDLIRCGVIPSVRGLYMGDEEESPIDACFVSHPHGDHYRYVSVLREGTAVYLPEGGHIIMRALEEVKEQKTFEERIEERVEEGEIRAVDFRTGDRLRVGGSGLEVEPVHVDHSISGAYGFLIRTSDGLVVYTGDFRRHGAYSALTEDFLGAVQGAGERVKLLMCEGTNIVRATPMTERDVYNQSRDIVGKTDGLVIVDHSQADIDRIRTIYRVAKRAGRELTVSKRIANTLNALTADPQLGRDAARILSDSSVYFGSEERWRGKRRKTRLERKIEGLFEGKERFAEEIKRDPAHYILATNVYRFEDLKELQPPPGSVYVLSASEPFEEEREFDFHRLLRWLDVYGVPLVHVHASGHAMPNNLRELIKAVSPEVFVPIHTEHPHLMGLYVSDCCDRVITPDRGAKVEVE